MLIKQLIYEEAQTKNINPMHVSLDFNVRSNQGSLGKRGRIQEKDS
jgi:hypothetical protein